LNTSKFSLQEPDFDVPGTYSADHTVWSVFLTVS